MKLINSELDRVLIYNKIQAMAFLKRKNIVILGIIAFLAISFWGSYFMLDENGKMTSCPFMRDHSSVCQMSVFEHIGQWKQLFNVIQERNLLSFLSILFVSLTAISFAINTHSYNKLKLQRFRNYFYWYKPEVKLFDHLAIALSQGNIRSQIYA